MFDDLQSILAVSKLYEGLTPPSPNRYVVIHGTVVNLSGLVRYLIKFVQIRYIFVIARIQEPDLRKVAILGFLWLDCLNCLRQSSKVLRDLAYVLVKIGKFDPEFHKVWLLSDVDVCQHIGSPGHQAFQLREPLLYLLINSILFDYVLFIAYLLVLEGRQHFLFKLGVGSK